MECGLTRRGWMVKWNHENTGEWANKEELLSLPPSKAIPSFTTVIPPPYRKSITPRRNLFAEDSPPTEVHAANLTAN